LSFYFAVYGFPAQCGAPGALLAAHVES